jgi:hypothetical protein
MVPNDQADRRSRPILLVIDLEALKVALEKVQGDLVKGKSVFHGQSFTSQTCPRLSREMSRMDRNSWELALASRSKAKMA